MKPPRSRSNLRRRGSALTLAMIFAILMGIALASFISLAHVTMKNADRSLHLHAAINVAEAGVDEALWALNKYQLLAWDPVDTTAFTGWTLSGAIGAANTTATRTITAFTNAQETSEFTSLLDWGTKPSRPILVVRARCNMPGRGTVEKYLWCQLSRRSLFANGLVARRAITFSGNNVSVDSYSSSKGAYNTTTNRTDNGSVASASVQIDPVVVGNADIWGRVATGGMAPDVGPNGTIASLGSAPGTVDASRVSSDFQANLDPISAPAIPSGAFTALPAKVGGNYVLGDASGTTQYYYLAGNVSLSGTEHILIQGPVVIVLTNGSFSAGGNTGVDIDSTAAAVKALFDTVGTPATKAQLKNAAKPPLQIYAAADFDLTGKGLLNTDPVYGVPAAVQIYGTSSTSQNIKIAGNGFLSASVFAPNAAVTTVGNGDTYGSIIADTIKYTGNGAFHYDESLQDLQGGKWAVDFWKELLTANERSGAWEGKTYAF